MYIIICIFPQFYLILACTTTSNLNFSDFFKWTVKKNKRGYRLKPEHVGVD